MTSLADFPLTGIHSNSKKIKKLSKSKIADCYSSDSSKGLAKEYTTYTKTQRQSIVTDLWEACRPNIGEDDHSADYLVKYLEGLDMGEYNQIIDKILAKNVPKALPPKKNKADRQKDLKQWRRRLKSWVKSMEKPDKRGNVRVVADEKISVFKERIIQTIQEMPTRSFEYLRQKALCILEQMHREDETATQPFDRHTFSKHFWYDFKKKHQDIADLYDNLPITRNKPSKNSKINKVTYKDMDEAAECSSTASLSYSLSANQECSTEDNSIQNEQISADEDHIEQGESSPFSPLRFDGLESVFISQNDMSFGNYDVIKSTQSAPEMPSCSVVQTFTALEQGPKFDFYRVRKMIVETEENETQQNFFRLFCQFGF